MAYIHVTDIQPDLGRSRTLTGGLMETRLNVILSWDPEEAPHIAKVLARCIGHSLPVNIDPETFDPAVKE